MKKILLLAFVMLCTTFSFAQTAPNDSITESLLRELETLLIDNNSLLQRIERELTKSQRDLTSKERYKMYQTENMYNFLLLDTQTGIIRQVQWSLNSKKEGSMSINNTDFSYSNYGPGSFELYPTHNLYQFILLDKIYGRKWHVQWGLETSDRWIRQIF